MIDRTCMYMYVHVHCIHFSRVRIQRQKYFYCDAILEVNVVFNSPTLPICKSYTHVGKNSGRLPSVAVQRFLVVLIETKVHNFLLEWNPRLLFFASVMIAVSSAAAAAAAVEGSKVLASSGIYCHHRLYVPAFSIAFNENSQSSVSRLSRSIPWASISFSS